MSALAELVRTFLALGTVLGVTAGMLAGLDAVPRALAPRPEKLSRFTTVEQAERRLGTHLALPAYFPETLAWPPSEVRVAAGEPPSVAITLVAQDGSGPKVVLCQTVGGEGTIAPELLRAPARVLESRAVQVAGAPGTLARIEAADGTLWYAMGWRHAGQTLVLRTRGSVEEAMQMAASVRRPR